MRVHGDATGKLAGGSVLLKNPLVHSEDLSFKLV